MALNRRALVATIHFELRVHSSREGPPHSSRVFHRTVVRPFECDVAGALSTKLIPQHLRDRMLLEAKHAALAQYALEAGDWDQPGYVPFIVVRECRVLCEGTCSEVDDTPAAPTGWSTF